jgi:regulator of sigma E protease
MIGTLFFFFLTLLILVLSHEAGHFFVARWLHVRVLRFSFGFGKVLFRLFDKQGTEYTWSLIPLGGYVKMLDEQSEPVPEALRSQAFNRQPLWSRFLIVLAGPLSNFVLAWFLLSLVMMIGVRVPVFSSIVEDVTPNTPAHHAGLMMGDKIINIDHQSMREGADVATYVRAHPDKTIVLEIERQDRLRTFKVHLTHATYQDVPQGVLGVQLKKAADGRQTVYRESFFHALKSGGQKTLWLIEHTFSFVAQLFRGHLSMEHVSGPVGIAQLAGESASHGLASYVLFIAMLSVSLGVLNLLPIPLLDGGYLLYYAIEFVIRRPLSQRVQLCAAYLGFGVIFFITALAFKNDLVRLGW